jgi:hypothetical protein
MPVFVVHAHAKKMKSIGPQKTQKTLKKAKDAKAGVERHQRRHSSEGWNPF